MAADDNAGAGDGETFGAGSEPDEIRFGDGPPVIGAPRDWRRSHGHPVGV